MPTGGPPLLLCLLLACCRVDCFSIKPPSPDEQPHLPDPHTWIPRVLDALEKLIGFYRRDYDTINLDGIFGLRACEAQLNAAVNHLENHPHTASAHVQQEVVRLAGLASMAANRSMPYLKANNPPYYNRFISAIEKAYKVPFHPRHVRPLSANQIAALAPSLHIKHEDNYDEKRGDVCFSQLMGERATSTSSSRFIRPPCLVTSQCAKMMLRPAMTQYAVTHQLLFFTHAHLIGCEESLKPLLPTAGIHDLQENLCDVIYYEAQRASASGSVPDKSQDLFLEQGLLCSMLGNVDFLREDWLQLVLSWQTVDGCFTNIGAQHLRYEIGRLKTLRHLLVENFIEDGGCLSHKSGLAAGLLGVYLRVMLQANVQSAAAISS